MDQDILALYGTSFSAKLYLLTAEGTLPLRLSRSSDKFDWGFEPQDDWLQAGGDTDSPSMRFAFRFATSDRLHYEITLPGPPRDASGIPSRKKLGVSRNGYLGFYWVAEVTDDWKLEPLQRTADGLVCYLRDHRGYRVGLLEDTPHNSGHRVFLLNVEDGEPCPFLLKLTR